MAVVFQLVERHLEQGEVDWFAAVVIFIVFSRVSVIAVCLRFSIADNNAPKEKKTNCCFSQLQKTEGQKRNEGRG